MNTKKIVAGVCAGIMTLSLTACGEKAEEPHISNTEILDYVDSSDNYENEYNEDEYKEYNIVGPALPISAKEIDYTSPSGIHMQGTLPVSPLNKERFNPDTTTEVLQTVEGIKDWALRRESYEQGYDHYVEQKQSTSFKRAESIIMDQMVDECPTGSSITVDYAYDTTYCINYSTICVTIEQYEDSGLTESDICEILKAVYGEEIGIFLFETEMGEDFNDAYCSSEWMEHGDINYGRRIMDGYRTYSIGLGSAYSSIPGYPGEEEMWTTTPTVLYDFLGLPEEERNVLDRESYGKTILEKYFGEGTRFPKEEYDFSFVGDTRVGFITDEFQDKESFMINQILDVPSATEEECYSALWAEDYENGEHSLSVLFGFASRPPEDWTPEDKEAVRQQAMEITRDLLKIEDIDSYFTGDEFYDMTIGGRLEWVHVSFEWNNYSGTSESATLFILTSSDMSRRY